MDRLSELRRILSERSLLENGPYRLASGKTSDYYLDLKLTTLDDPHALRLASEIILDRILKLGTPVDAVGGLTSGADPLVIGVTQLAYDRGMKLRAFFVRDEQKSHGTERVIEGTVRDGMKVVILDDVITTGNSVLKAIRPVEKHGARVIKVVVLVDREEGGGETLHAYSWEAIFSVRELRTKK